jgi:hypothetical protein
MTARKAVRSVDKRFMSFLPSNPFGEPPTGMTMKRLLYCVGAIGGKVQVPSRIAPRGWYKRRE